MTYPSLAGFFNTHVIGDTPINYNDFFEKVGLEVASSKVKTNYAQNAGALIFGANQENGAIYFNNLVSNNSFWNDQGVQPNDIVKSIDGTPVTMKNANQILGQVISWQPGKDIEVVIIRNDEEHIIKTTLTQPFTVGKVLHAKDNATGTQITLRNAWLKV
jgi:C-terminal processing protease CtpA/Prc